MARIDYYRDPAAPKAHAIRVAVTVLVQDAAGRVLLIRRTDNDLYSIPGGQQEPGETLTGTAVREVEEETGFRVEVTELIGLYSDPEHVIAYGDGEVRQEFSICFRAHLLGGHPRTSAESSDVRWTDPAALADLSIHPSIRLRIGHGLARRGAPYYT